MCKTNIYCQNEETEVFWRPDAPPCGISTHILVCHTAVGDHLHRPSESGCMKQKGLSCTCVNTSPTVHFQINMNQLKHKHSNRCFDVKSYIKAQEHAGALVERFLHFDVDIAECRRKSANWVSQLLSSRLKPNPALTPHHRQEGGRCRSFRTINRNTKKPGADLALHVLKTTNTLMSQFQ